MTTDFFAWVNAHLNDDPARLRLKYSRGGDGSVDYAAAITQIECRRRFARKFAYTLAACPDFYFPSVLAGEQATSDTLALFHSSYVAEGCTAIDLTAGLGIDALYSARRASSLTAVERDADKVEALRHNAAALKADNIEAVHGDCIEFIDRCLADGRHFTTAFIDPARRAADGSRVFALADCEPDVTALADKLSKLCDILLVKVSPMLDISHTIASLSPAPVSIMAIGTAGDCKELFAIVDFRNPAAETMVEAVTLGAGETLTFAYRMSQEHECPMPPLTGELAPGDYVYEPYPALMKCGAFRLPAQRYGLSVFHANTRLFTSRGPVDGFPGRRYTVVEVLPYASRVIKRFAAKYPAINVATRNFGISADALKAKLRVKDGGDMRLFGVTDSAGERLLVVCKP